ncbi:AbfB domain-containing protein [Catellatospora sichuanensis]|uniref:AbfB domain-containing protein n=1 Tax=Catellatospora sichuanensis TaxID=1969805 RepID=UPI00118466A0|nr:AbfB domain-containing protein [Catellatospora sichuanensis]
MTKHRLNEDDATTIMPRVSLPATVEELAAQEREPAAKRSRRPVVIVAAVTAVLTTAATGWALAQPANQPVSPPVALATGGSRGFVEGFGEVSASAEAPSRSLPRSPAARPSAHPSPNGASSGAPVPPGQPLASSALVTGSQRSLRAADRPDRFVRQGGGLASLVSVTAASSGGVRQAATFTVVAGLADRNCFSFVGVDGGYLRHRDWRIRHEQSNGSQLFRADATFCVRPGAVPGAVYLESHNYRGYYVHLRGDELWIDRWRDRDAGFDRECAFAITAPWG